MTRVLSPLFFLLIALTTTTVMAASVTLRWDANTPAPEGYRVFARQDGQAYDYSQPAWQGTATTCALDNLAGKTTHYFVVRAFDGNQESADSVEVSYTTSGLAAPAAMTDTDGDGIPDDWEASYGLDPTVNDANGDLDGDGISNRDEYRAGLDPTDPGIGTPPDTPQPISPLAYAQVASSPELAASDYSDPDGDAHIATQWQIFDTASGDCLFDVISDRRLTQLQVPLLVLKGGMTCSWRLRYFDSGGKVSDWSDSAYFTTQSANNDQDGNGISDDQENGPVTVTDVHSLTPMGMPLEPTGIAVSSADTVSAIKQMTVVDPKNFPIDETTPSQLPSSMAVYRLALKKAGQRAQVTIHLSTPAPAGARWVKYDAVNGWQDFSNEAVFSSDRQTVTVEIKDGGVGDADGVANGIIVDPSGLLPAGTSSSTPSASSGGGGGGGGGGCFITSIAGAGQTAPAGHRPWRWLKATLHQLIAFAHN
jgi:hypothetical protein